VTVIFVGRGTAGLYYTTRMPSTEISQYIICPTMPAGVPPWTASEAEPLPVAHIRFRLLALDRDARVAVYQQVDP